MAHRCHIAALPWEEQPEEEEEEEEVCVRGNERGETGERKCIPEDVYEQGEEKSEVERAVEEEKIRRVREAVSGRYVAVPSPLRGGGGGAGGGGAGGGRVFGAYADWTASARALEYVEDYIRSEVHPFYGNTHTSASFSGFQSSAFLAEARQRVAVSFNARVQRSDAHSDVVIFTGAGATSALNHLVGVLRPAMRAARRCVVLVGPAEHHSNLLPWREAVGARGRVLEVPPDEATGTVCIASLVRMLEHHTTADPDFGSDVCADGNGSPVLVIGAFSAASNVTGIAERVVDLARACRHFGALCCIDAASAAGSLDVDMNPSAVPGGLDAVAFSGHKLPGGVGTPGVLIVKKRLLKLDVAPTRPGGGTVFFVTSADHRYLSQREDREEGGSRDLVGITRLALALQVKRRVGTDAIARRDEQLVTSLVASIAEHPRVLVLGPGVARRPARPSGEALSKPASSAFSSGRLPVVSFLILAPASATADRRVRFLHYGFVCSLLNDLFGIQTRGGCVCSGPFAHRLLGIRASDSAEIERLMIEDTEEVLRPGFTRVSVNYLTSDDEAAYISEAVALVATHGWRMLPQYQYIHKTGEWKHASRVRAFPERRWLAWSTWPLESDVRRRDGGDDKVAACFSSAASCTTASPLRERKRTAVAAGEAELREHWRSQLDEARQVLLASASRSPPSGSSASEADVGRCASLTAMSSADAERMRWFMLPGEAAALLLRSSSSAAHEHGLPVNGGAPPSIVGPIQPMRFPDLSAAGPPALDWSPPRSMRKSASVVHVSERDAAGAPPSTTSTPPPPPPPMLVCARSGDTVAKEVTKDAGMPMRAESRKYPLRSMESLLSTSSANSTAAAPASDFRHPLSETFTPATAPPPHMKGSVAPLGTASAPVPPSPKLMKAVVRAICEWQMIRDGDRVVVGLSGGKDSLCLLHCLLHIKRTRRPPISFDLAAATVDPGTDAYNPRPLIPYLASLGVPYHYIETPIMDLASAGHMQGDSICAFCSRMRRGALYTCCRENGYNVLALGQHLDDLAESFVMSVFHNGKMRTMKASYTVDAGDLRVIRPLMGIRESATRDFSYSASLPVIADNCPACFSAPQERHHVKKLLAKEEGLFPNVYSCIARAMAPLYDPGLQDVLDAWVRAKRDHARKRAPKKKPVWSTHGGDANGHESGEASVVDEEPATRGADARLRLEDIATEDLFAELVRRGSETRRGNDAASSAGTSAPLSAPMSARSRRQQSGAMAAASRGELSNVVVGLKHHRLDDVLSNSAATDCELAVGI